MQRICTLATCLFFALSGSAFGQTYALTPQPRVQFFLNNTGLPASGAKVCTFAAGGVTPLATYADASGTPNSNPIILDASGRATIYLGAASYKFSVRTIGTDGTGAGATCPGGAGAGSTIFTQDNIADFGQLLAAGLIDIINPRIDNVRYCNAFAGVNAGAKIIACLADLPSTGGTADARGIEGAQSILNAISIGANKTLLLGAATYTCNFAGVCFTLNGSGAQLLGLERDATVIATNSTSAPFTTALITADGATLRHFTISTTVPAGMEAGQLAAITLSKSSQLADVTIDDLYISGANNAIMGDVLIPLGVKHLRITNNKIRGLQYGIAVQTFAAGIVNSDIVVQNNDVEVTALGGYNGYWLARSIAIFNCNGCKILNNRAMGGFNGIEVLGNLGNPSTGRPHMQSVIVSGNTIDSSPTVAQCDSCVFSNNTIDMSLRDPAWPPYTSAEVVTNSGLRPGAELSDNLGLTVTANSISGAVGDGVDFGADPHSTFTGNTIYNAGNSPNPNVYERSCLELTYISSYVTISGNTFDTCKGAGINQTLRESFSGVFGVVVDHNIIKNTQTHGIHFHNVGQEGLVITGNSVSSVNLTGGAFDAINLSIDNGTGGISGVTVADNITSGGRYGVAQTYIDSTSNRLMDFRGNRANSATTAGFSIHGRTINNWDSAWTTGTQATLAAGVLDASAAYDFVALGAASAGNFTRIDNGTLGKTITVYFATGGITVVNSVNLMLTGAVSVAAPAGSAITFINTGDGTATSEAWQEVGRNFYGKVDALSSVNAATTVNAETNLTVHGASAATAGGYVSLGTTVGTTAGTAGTTVTTTTLGAGTGPTNAQVVTQYLKFYIGSTPYWIPLMQFVAILPAGWYRRRKRDGIHRRGLRR